MRVGVIGTGVAGSSHLFDLASSDRYSVAAVCARRRHRAAEAARLYGARSVFDDPAALLAETRLDAVVIATPPHTTPTVVRLALGLGLPTLIDKPAAATAAALDQVLTDSALAFVGAVVGYNRRYQRHVHHARELIASEEPGTVLSVECRWTGPFTHRFASGDTYRQGVEWGDGVVLDTASHIFDTLGFLGIAPLVAERAHLAQGSHGADVAANLRLRGGDGHGAPVSVRICDCPGDERWTIVVNAAVGSLALTRTGLRGNWRRRPVQLPASDLRRPVDDLSNIADSRPTLGASLPDAVTVLALVDQVRTIAARRRSWLRPRAKALGRLNGAC